MSQAQDINAEPQAAMSEEAAIDAIADLAHSWLGLKFEVDKRHLLRSRLSKRLRATKLASITEYLELVSSDQGRQERSELMSALTTNITSFYRENHHFEILRAQVLPRMMKILRSGGRARVWSAGCSSGPEPYSIALTALMAEPSLAQADFRILATDIDPVVLAKARSGIYSGSELNGLPADAPSNLVARTAEQVEFTSVTRDLITFNQLNLIGDWPMKGRFDVIFCRNVAIYFDQDTQIRLWRRFVEKLPIGGHLIIGHSERIKGSAENCLEQVGMTAFRKISD